VIRPACDVLRSFCIFWTNCVPLDLTPSLEISPLNDDPASQALAHACSEAMHQNDCCSRMLGIVVDDARPGYAKLSMVVRDDMVNGHGTCHGGIIFTVPTKPDASTRCQTSRTRSPGGNFGATSRTGFSNVLTK